MILLTVTEFRKNIGKYLQLAFTEKIAVKSKKGIIELTPSKDIELNPSPGGDPWFENACNMKELERAIREINSDKADFREFSDNELKEFLSV